MTLFGILRFSYLGSSRGMEDDKCFLVGILLCGEKSVEEEWLRRTSPVRLLENQRLLGVTHTFIPSTNYNPSEIENRPKSEALGTLCHYLTSSGA